MLAKCSFRIQATNKIKSDLEHSSKPFHVKNKSTTDIFRMHYILLLVPSRSSVPADVAEAAFIVPVRSTKGYLQNKQLTNLFGTARLSGGGGRGSRIVILN